MPSVNKILIIMIAVLLVAVVWLLWWQTRSPVDDYYAVLSGGELFFGRLHYFPKFYLTNVWVIQQNPQDKENPVRLVKFETSFWGPEDKLYLNSKNIIWKTKLKADSQVVQQIKNAPALLQQQQSAQSGALLDMPNQVSSPNKPSKP